MKKKIDSERANQAIVNLTNVFRDYENRIADLQAEVNRLKEVEHSFQGEYLDVANNLAKKALENYKLQEEANKKKVIIYLRHDRHTDDDIKIYPYSEENWEKVKEKVDNYWKMPRYEEGLHETNYTDFSHEMGCDESYYCACDIRDMDDIRNLNI